MSRVKTESTPDQDTLKKVLDTALDRIKKKPEQAKASFTASSNLEEGLLSEINIREFTFVSDEPEELGGTNRGPNPVEYILGALAACQEIVVKTHASLLGIDVQSVKVEAEGNLDLQGFLDLTETRPGFHRVSFRTEIETGETDEKKLRQLEELTYVRCPVLDIIENPVSVEGDVRFIS